LGPPQVTCAQVWQVGGQVLAQVFWLHWVLMHVCWLQVWQVFWLQFVWQVLQVLAQVFGQVLTQVLGQVA
jgi:hypothetical protein